MAPRKNLGGSHDQAQIQDEGFGSLNYPKDGRSRAPQATCTRIIETSSAIQHQA